MYLKHLNAFIVSCFLASGIFSQGMVIVHVHQTELVLPKSDLIQQSGFFKTLFEDVFKGPLPDNNGNYHVQLCRNEKSMQALWDFLIYGDISETDPKILNRMKKDAEYLQIDMFLKALKRHQKKCQPEQESEWRQKVKVIAGQGNQKKNLKRNFDLQQQLDKFFANEGRFPLSVSPITYSGDGCWGTSTVMMVYKEKCDEQ